MSQADASPEWPKLAELMSDRFGGLTESVLENLRLLLDAGRQLVHCAESALMIPEEKGTHLRFLVSVNSRPGIEEIVRQIRVPCDRSIAGCVFTTGQLIAIANPEDHYQQVDEKTGLKTNIYLAAPVMSDDAVLGVMTFVNRPGEETQEPFNEKEIQTSLQLADLAAVGLRGYHRIALQQRLFATELQQALERIPEAVLQDEFSFQIQAGEEETEKEAALARALLALERLSPREQNLAAELMQVVAEYGDESGPADDLPTGG